MTSYSSCSDGTCQEVRDMDLEAEEKVSDRYLRRSNELLARFSKDLSSDNLVKRSDGTEVNIGDAIRDIEDLYRQLEGNNIPSLQLLREIQGLTGDLCDELNLTTPLPRECSRLQAYRNIDGSCNNLRNPLWGRSNYPLKRLYGVDYDDGISEFCSTDTGNAFPPFVIPTAREVSVGVTGSEEIYNPYGASELTMHFGQFVDHDLAHVPTEEAECDGCNEDDICCPIGVPSDDPVFSSLECLEFKRARPMLDENCLGAVRHHENQITSYLDSSNVYGSNEEEEEELRDKTKGTGQMKVDEEPIDLSHLPVLPPDEQNPDCVPGAKEELCGKGGDVRAAEQPGLTGIHTLLVREHNRVASSLSLINTDWTDDQLYHETKKIINAVYQHILYNEFLPILLGERVVEDFGLGVGNHYPYTGYDDTVDATVVVVFAAAAFRFGHSFVPETLFRYNAKHEAVYPALPLKEAFFNATHVYDFENGGLDSILLGMLDQPLLKIDRHLSPAITQFLFAHENASFGMDLVSLNIQRGRDLGIPSYAEIFNSCHGRRLNRFSQLEFTNNDAVEALENVYDRVGDIDAFIGMITEEPLSGAALGPTAACVVAEQFYRLKYGDRFWYENTRGPQSFTSAQLSAIREMSYARLMCENLASVETIQPYAFMLPDSGRGRGPRRYNSFVEFSRNEKYPSRDGSLPNFSNHRVPCANPEFIPKLDLEPWRE